MRPPLVTDYFSLFLAFDSYLSSLPPSVPRFAEHRVPDAGSDLDVDPDAHVILNAVIINVGGSGYYDDVVDMDPGEDMSCPSFPDSCVKEVRRSHTFGSVVYTAPELGVDQVECRAGHICRCIYLRLELRNLSP